MEVRGSMKVRAKRCETCWFWVEEDRDSESGQCRRYPPTVAHAAMMAKVLDDYLTSGSEGSRKEFDYESGVDALVTVFPESDFHEWCGEWKAKDATAAESPNAINTMEAVRRRLNEIDDTLAELNEEANMLRARLRRLGKQK